MGSTRKPQGYVALLRAINVGGRNRVPMAELRRMCGDLGWSEVRTYIQSGNVVFLASGDSAALEAKLEGAIEGELGLKIAVMVRKAADWRRCLAANPFPAESEAEPARVMLCMPKSLPPVDAGPKIEEKGKDGERAAIAGGALWIYYPAGLGRSKVTPNLLDRLAGSPVTARNWRTALELDRILTEITGE